MESDLMNELNDIVRYMMSSELRIRVVELTFRG